MHQSLILVVRLLVVQSLVIQSHQSFSPLVVQLLIIRSLVVRSLVVPSLVVSLQHGISIRTICSHHCMTYPSAVTTVQHIHLQSPMYSISICSHQCIAYLSAVTTVYNNRKIIKCIRLVGIFSSTLICPEIESKSGLLQINSSG